MKPTLANDALHNGHVGRWSKHRFKQTLQKVCPHGVEIGSHRILKKIREIFKINAKLIKSGEFSKKSPILHYNRS